MPETTPSIMKAVFQGEVLEGLAFPFPTMDEDEADTVKIISDNLLKWAEDNYDASAADEQTAFARVYEALSSIDGSLPVTVGGHASIGIKGLLLYGTEEQKRKYLPDLAAGRKMAAFALTEPGAGSDAAIDLYGMLAVLSRVTSRIDAVGEEAARPEMDIVRIYCEGAWRRVHRNLRQIRRHQDRSVRRLAAYLIDRRHYDFPR